tara:strand:+ start:425 stop:1468 length:1044 start_codon:yes stop_codon:yes gene_type:complete
MANQSKFEAMLEKLIAEDKAGAEELFHEIVVEKSRSIYEQLIEDDVADVEVDEASKSEDEKVDEKEAKADDEAVDEASKEDADDKVEEKADAKDEDKVEEKTDEKAEDKVEEADAEATDEKANEDFEDVITPEADADMKMGGDAADDMIADIEDDGEDKEDDDDADDKDMEDRVVDLEDALDDLKAEFDSMMSDKKDDDMGDEDKGDMDDMDDEGDEEKEDEAIEVAPEAELDIEQPAMETKVAQSSAELMREYVTKVSAPSNNDAADNKKSTVAGKNDMGGDASNIVKGGEETGGKAESPKEDSAGNVNVPGGKASKSMSAMPKGHGAEKKGAGEGADNKKSTIGS